MRLLRRRSALYIALAAAAVLLCSVLRMSASDTSPFRWSAVQTLVFLIYTFLIAAWGASVSRRISHRRIRFYALLSMGMLLLWVLLRTIRFDLEGAQRLKHFCWYSYYIPMLFLSLFGLQAAICVAEPENANPEKKYRLLLIPSVLLIIGIETNDLHQLAFRFGVSHSGEADTYSYGILYYLTVAWILALFVCMLIRLWSRCRVLGAKRLIWLPFVPVTVGVVYTVLYCLGVPGIGFFEMTAMLCFLDAAIWECCIMVGLIPSNFAYADLFSASSMAAQITDLDGAVYFAGEKARKLPAEVLYQARSGAFLLDAKYRLRSHPIPGGYVYWQENISRVNKVVSQLRETQERLAENNELLQAELNLKQRSSRIDEQNRLYDRIAADVEPQLRMIEQLLSGNSENDAQRREILAGICCLGAYCKRRANLILLGENAGLIPAEELAHCLRESADNLRIGQIACSFCSAVSGMIPLQYACVVYDFFEAVLEASLDSLHSVLIDLKTENSAVILRITAEGGKLPEMKCWQERTQKIGGSLSCVEENGVRYYRLLLAERREN